MLTLFIFIKKIKNIKTLQLPAQSLERTKDQHKQNKQEQVHTSGLLESNSL